MKNLKLSVFALFSILAITSCSKDEVIAVNTEEVITTIKIVFTPVGNGNPVTLTYRDLDGEGPLPAIISPSATFMMNKTYNGEVTVLNESVVPAKDITEEIQTEALDHQLFYQKTGTLSAFNYTPIGIAPSNFDSNGKPIGLKTIFVTTTAATGTLRITLRHEGNKSAANVANGDITNATGATDFEITFNGLVVQ